MSSLNNAVGMLIMSKKDFFETLKKKQV